MAKISNSSQSPCPHQCAAAIWKNGALIAVPTLAGGNNAEAFFTDQSGETVGVSEIETPDATCATPALVYRFEVGATRYTNGSVSVAG